MTIQEFIEKYNITMKCKRVDNNNPDMPNMDAWKCTLTHKGDGRPVRMTVDYYMGYGHNGKAPSVDDVLGTLRMDYLAADGDFEYFCSTFGYDTDSRSALRIHKALKKIVAKMDKWVDEDYEMLDVLMDVEE